MADQPRNATNAHNAEGLAVGAILRVLANRIARIEGGDDWTVLLMAIRRDVETEIDSVALSGLSVPRQMEMRANARIMVGGIIRPHSEPEA